MDSENGMRGVTLEERETLSSEGVTTPEDKLAEEELAEEELAEEELAGRRERGTCKLSDSGSVGYFTKVLVEGVVSILLSSLSTPTAVKLPMIAKLLLLLAVFRNGSLRFVGVDTSLGPASSSTASSTAAAAASSTAAAAASSTVPAVVSLLSEAHATIPSKKFSWIFFSPLILFVVVSLFS